MLKTVIQALDLAIAVTLIALTLTTIQSLSSPQELNHVLLLLGALTISMVGMTILPKILGEQ